MPRAVWRAVIVLGLTWCATSAYALDPSWAMSQYIRHRWGSDRGFGGGPVYAITQTGDGYLWIASEKGLLRFDGLTFRLFEPPGLTSSSSPAVLGVVAAPDGSLWARLRGPALVRYRGGAFEDLLGVLDLPDNVVTALLRSNDGAVLVSSLGFGVIAYRPGQRVTVITRDAMPGSAFPISMAQANDGAIWLGTRDAGVLGIRGAEVTRITAGLPDLKINCLLPGENGTLWIGTDRGVVRWTGREVTTAGVPAPLKSLPALAMIQDRQSNIWIAAGPRGLYRMSHGVVSTLERHDRDARTDVTTVFEDRDGSLWVGTDRGIEQWRDAVFTTYTVAQGMPTDAIGPIFADAADRTWFAPIDGGLCWMRSGAIHRVDDPGLNDDVVYSIAGSGDELWLGRQRGGLTRLHAARGVIAEQFTQVNGLTQNSVYAVHRARDGAIWAGTLSGGVSRHKGGAFTNYGVADGLASNTVA
jgi:ligand-binding sensor domain-containing protein